MERKLMALVKLIPTIMFDKAIAKRLNTGFDFVTLNVFFVFIAIKIHYPDVIQIVTAGPWIVCN